MPSYLPSDYLTDFTDQYNAFQRRFATTIPERDRALLAHLHRALPAWGQGIGKTVLDIGCSTGNLLRLIRQQWPSADYWGGDIAPAAVETCRHDPTLDRITFEVIDLTTMTFRDRFDLAIANAVAVYFPDKIYQTAMKNIGAAMRQGGTYVAFEWIHPFNQELTITEVSASHPLGLEIHFRSYGFVEQALKAAGFRSVEFCPFEIPIDLPKPPADIAPFEQLTTYTEQLANGSRIQFRGVLAQPWCHLIAQR
jgi:SAM-dependent methyltransferase